MKKINKEIILTPCDGRKSFYGKATVLDDGERLYLKSYDTIVCSLGFGDEPKFQRHWNGYSHTTMRHIKSFAEEFGHFTIDKKKWMALDVINI